MDYYERNRANWISIINTVFKGAEPVTRQWNNIDEIIDILNIVGSFENSNHMFYPTGGGMDIISARYGYENGCIEIHTGLTDLLKPKSLVFEKLDDPIWSYFRLETEKLLPSGVYDENNYSSEEVAELTPGKYIHRSHLDTGEYHEQPLPKEARSVTRHMKGSFVVFAKSSPYNRNASTYDARHNKMSATEFRAYIEKISKYGWKE